MWNILASSLRVIHNKKVSKLSFEEPYPIANKLMLKKWGETVYIRVQEFEDGWLANEIQPQIIGMLPQPLLLATPGAQIIATTNEKSLQPYAQEEGKTLSIILKEFEEEWLENEIRPRLIEELSPTHLLATSEAQTIATANENRVAGENLSRALKQEGRIIVFAKMAIYLILYMNCLHYKELRKSLSQLRDPVLMSPLSDTPNKQISIAQTLNAVVLEQLQTDREGDILYKLFLKSCAQTVLTKRQTRMSLPSSIS